MSLLWKLLLVFFLVIRETYADFLLNSYKVIFC